MVIWLTPKAAASWSVRAVPRLEITFRTSTSRPSGDSKSDRVIPDNLMPD
jgi:hypothetical protein